MNRTMEINCFELNFSVPQFTKHNTYIAYLFIQLKKHNEGSLKKLWMKIFKKINFTILKGNNDEEIYILQFY